jgi:hypothetical protein
VRQRSRSIVRDARSLIEMIDSKGGDGSPRRTSSGDREDGRAAEESTESRASTVRGRGFMQKDKSKNPEKKMKLL